MLRLEEAKQRVFDRCNIIGSSVDIYKYLYMYKAIRELDDEQIDEIYDEISAQLGF